jgi:hypothetical protein
LKHQKNLGVGDMGFPVIQTSQWNSLKNTLINLGIGAISWNPNLTMDLLKNTQIKIGIGCG